MTIIGRIEYFTSIINTLLFGVQKTDRVGNSTGLQQPVDVHLGEQTLDEMCLGIFGILAPPGAIEQFL